MKNLFFALLLIGTSLPAWAQADEYDRMPYVLGELLVQVDNNQNINAVAERLKIVNGVFTEIKVSDLVSEPTNIWLLKFNHNNISHLEMLRAVRSHHNVLIAQNNHIVEERVTTPNDPQFGSLWYHNDGASDNDIDSDLAWDITTGGQTANGDDIVVCVLEGSGAQWQHQDIIDNHWTNTAEAGGANGVDDDGNGYVDDINGWNVGTNNDNVGTGNHGTGVSSMIGAKGNNGTNVVGANWDVKIMQVDMAGTSESAVIAAYTYPLVMRRMWNNSGGTQGAFVVATNASWGINQGDPASAPLWCNFYDTLGFSGILNFGATANANWDIDVVGDLPTACSSDYMISVTATNNNDVRTFSGYGQTTIDLGAPGEDVLMAYTGTTGTSTVSGTSFATPLTAGVCALMYSVPCTNLADLALDDPQEAADIIRQAIFDGVDPVSNLTTETVTGGRLNAFNSVTIIQTDCGTYGACTVTGSSSVTNLTCAGQCIGSVTLAAGGGTGTFTYDLNDGNGPQASPTFSNLCAGNYTVTIDDGNCQENVSFTVNEPGYVSTSISKDHVTCFGDNNGELTLNGSGGTPPYEYSIDNGSTFQSSAVFNGLAPGTYDIVVEDDNGCSFTTSTNINEPAVLGYSNTVSNVISGSDGSIDLTVTGGTPPYSYSWTGSNSYTSTTEDPAGLDAGVYTCTVTDLKGCVVTTASIEVFESTAGIGSNEIQFTVYPNPTNELLNINFVGLDNITMSIIDNTGRYIMTKMLNNENNTVEVSHLAAGVYNLQLRNTEGFVSNTQIIIQ
jgi:hypothetical protein